MRAAGSAHFVCSCGTDARRDFVYGWTGFPKTRSVAPDLHHPTPAEDHRSVADVVAEREIVGDEEDPEAALLQLAEQIEDVDARRGVEHADDLVGDEQPDVEQERARDEQSLELASAQLMGVLAEDVSGVEAHRIQRPRQLRVPLGRAEAWEVARPQDA